MFYATYNIQSFTTLFCRYEGSKFSWFMPLSILFQSFTTHVLWAGSSCFMALSIFSHLPHFCCRQWGSGGSCFLQLSIMFQ
jgi:hypothetical protein